MKEQVGNTPLLVLFDNEEEYTLLMSDFLREHRELPWRVRSYTRIENLLAGEKEGGVTILLVSESSFNEKLKEVPAKQMIILNESGLLHEDDYPNVDKYQAAEDVLRQLIELYKEFAEDIPQGLATLMKTNFIGVYSPVKRVLQSSFALTLSEILAEKYPTLYISFEHYTGVADLLPGLQDTDLSDLVYFLNADSEKFKLHFQTMCRQRGNLTFIPPMRWGQNILTVTPQEWTNLLHRINEYGMFEYVVMDLTDSMQGLLDILRICCKVFTLISTDRYAATKLIQYENILNLYEYTDVIEKTTKFSLPKFQSLPESIDQYTNGDLAEFVRGKLPDIVRKSE